jgi:hypothetical protein
VTSCEEGAGLQEADEPALKLMPDCGELNQDRIEDRVASRSVKAKGQNDRLVVRPGRWSDRDRAPPPTLWSMLHFDEWRVRGLG